MFPVRESASPDEFRNIMNLRYRVLRQPWDQPFETSQDELEDHAVNAYIADETGEVIACGRLQENAARTGQVRFMAVDPGQQGKGLGRQVLRYLEEKAVTLGFVKIELQARENAVYFYEANGYRVREKSFLLWGLIQHYLMEKVLDKGKA